jgi:hypothetical protein
VLGHEVDGLPAVGGGGDDLDAGQEPEEQDEALADTGLVVSDWHALWPHFKHYD